MKDRNNCCINELMKIRQKHTKTEISNIYQAVFDNASDGIIIAGIEDMKFYMGNQMICDMLGYSLKEIKNMGVTDIHPEADLPYVIEQFERLSRGKIIFAKDIPTIRKDGSIFYADIKAFFVTLAGKSYIAGIFRDSTERKLTEEALRASENKYRMLVEHSLQGILIACDSPLRFVFVNQSLADIFGYTTNELMSLTAEEINSLLHPEDYSAVSQRFRERLAGKQVLPRYEGRIVRKNGTERWVEIYSSLIEYEGNPAVQSAFIDITERKLAEQALQQREKDLALQATNLEEVNTALKVLLKKRDEDKIELEEKVLLNIKELVLPYFEKIRKGGLDKSQRAYADILESHLKEIVSSFSYRLSFSYLNLTPTEINVANLVKQGKTNKEIAELLNVSTRTAAFHREHIRQKLGIKNQKTNLRSYLSSIN